LRKKTKKGMASAHQPSLRVFAFHGMTGEMILAHEMGVDAFEQDSNGQTLVHIAAIAGNVDTLKCLYSLDPKKTCSLGEFRGQSPLELAVRARNWDVVDFFKRVCHQDSTEIEREIKNERCEMIEAHMPVRDHDLVNLQPTTYS
jgi:hypothetical protein